MPPIYRYVRKCVNFVFILTNSDVSYGPPRGTLRGSFMVAVIVAPVFVDGDSRPGLGAIEKIFLSPSIIFLRS